MDKIIVSLIQMNIKTNHVRENMTKAADLIDKCSKYKPNYIVFPEMWTTGFAYDNLMELAKQYQDEIIAFLIHYAKKLKSIIVGGSTPHLQNGKIYNTCFVVAPNGDIIGSYSKIHSFSPFDEDKYFESGEKAKTFNSINGKIGVIICYDLRFPELTRKLALDNMEILFVPAQFPAIRENHWNTLLKARAIENAIFVCGCNRIGSDKKFEYSGDSQIIDPWGEIIEKGNQFKEEIITGSLNLQKIYDIRKIIPIYKDRKPNTYK